MTAKDEQMCMMHMANAMMGTGQMTCAMQMRMAQRMMPMMTDAAKRDMAMKDMEMAMTSMTANDEKACMTQMQKVMGDMGMMQQ